MFVSAKYRLSRLLDLFAASQRALRAAGMVLAPPFLRIALALPFLRSGRTRWEGYFHLSFATPFLFQEMFKLHLFGRVVDIPAPTVTAYVVAVAEIVLPILLLLGLATRLAALGLLVMTGVIQLVVPDGWANFHLYWASLALAILALGAGKFSCDSFLGYIGQRYRQLPQTTKQESAAPSQF